MNRLNEKDDGIFDWMSVMDTTKREKLKKPEADKVAARVISGATGGNQKMSPPSPLITNAHGSNRANSSKVNSPLTKDPIQNAKSPLGNPSRKPTQTRTSNTPQPTATTANNINTPASKVAKKSFFQRMCGCISSSKE